VLLTLAPRRGVFQEEIRRRGYNFCLEQILTILTMFDRDVHITMVEATLPRRTRTEMGVRAKGVAATVMTARAVTARAVIATVVTATGIITAAILRHHHLLSQYEL
jgi:hypothetical protein